jgi:hypothetical protein
VVLYCTNENQVRATHNTRVLSGCTHFWPITLEFAHQEMIWAPESETQDATWPGGVGPGIKYLRRGEFSIEARYSEIGRFTADVFCDLCRVPNAASKVPTVSLGLSGVSSRPGTCVWPAHMWDSRRRNGVDRGVCQDFARESVSRWSRIRVDRHAWVSVGTSTCWTQIWGTRCAIRQAGRGAFGPKRSDPGGTDSPTWTPQNESVTPR